MAGDFNRRSLVDNAKGETARQVARPDSIVRNGSTGSPHMRNHDGYVSG